jgi:hypothetical protein
MAFSFPLRGISGNGAKIFQCSACGSQVSRSDHLISLGGMNRHVFINPAGVECDFQTFISCPGAVAFGEATDEHTWFTGYAWRMAFCRQCGQHLGWYYQGMSRTRKPSEFWGILVSRVVTRAS